MKFFNTMNTTNDFWRMTMMVKSMVSLQLIVLSSAFQLPQLSSPPAPPIASSWTLPLLSAVGGDSYTDDKSAVGTREEARSVVERCYSSWNRDDMESAASCFRTDFTYDDGQFFGTIKSNKSELISRFRLGKTILPPKSTLVLDNIAVCLTTSNIGTRWHVENENGDTISRTRGCSFYTIDDSNGLISTGFKVSEMVVKPSKDIANGLVTSASKLMQSTTPAKESFSSKTATTEEKASTSIIEAYFKAWNERDMNGALDCFVEDCVYETEDPVFVDTFKGKDSLREHLEKNAAALPAACKIILDDLAIDVTHGTAGVKWHLEANGVPIPNLRGCSMYTMDNDTGLLQSGFDVTEAPVKFPGVAQTLLTAVPSALFRQFLS